MIVLDTNVLSGTMQVVPEQAVVRWMDAQPSESLWLTAVTVLEVRLGLEKMAPGRKRSRLEEAFAKTLHETFAGRILPLDVAGAEAAAVILARLFRAGRPIDLRDAQIAGVATARRAMLATRNVRHFSGLALPLVNPWSAPTRRP